MPIRKVPHKKPNDDDKATVYIVGKDRIDIVARKNKNNSISCIQRLNKDEMINIITGEITRIKKKQYKNERDIKNQMVNADRLITVNFKGKPSEKLLEIYFSREMPDFKDATDLSGNFLDRLKRKYGKLDFIRITMFEGQHKPFFQIWIKTQDNTDFDITDVELDKLWGQGKSKVIEITPDNIERLIRFELRDKTAIGVYPAGIQIISKSKGIRNVEVIQEDYKKGSKRTKGFRTEYKSTKEVYDINIKGEEKIFQTITFESYRRKKKTLKIGGRAEHKEYKSKKKVAEIIKSKEELTVKEENKETQAKVKKKPMRVIEQENNILFAEIGKEVEEKINQKKGGNDYERK